MWSRQTRAPHWQIGGDGHCGAENETPNLLWWFPRARRWRSAQGCDRKNRGRPKELHHCGAQTHPRRQKVSSIKKKKIISLCYFNLTSSFFGVISLGSCGSGECHFNPAAVVSSGFILVYSGSEHHAAGSTSVECNLQRNPMGIFFVFIFLPARPQFSFSHHQLTERLWEEETHKFGLNYLFF